MFYNESEFNSNKNSMDFLLPLDLNKYDLLIIYIVIQLALGLYTVKHWLKLSHSTTCIRFKISPGVGSELALPVMGRLDLSCTCTICLDRQIANNACPY